MVSIVPADVDGLRQCQEQLAVVYGQCFAAPPWKQAPAEIADYPAQLQRQTSYPAPVASSPGPVRR